MKTKDLIDITLTRMNMALKNGNNTEFKFMSDVYHKLAAYQIIESLTNKGETDV